MLWTRINPEQWNRAQTLRVQVASDAAGRDLVLQADVSGEEFGPESDYTVHLHIDGVLEADTRYYYRFVYRDTASRTGRCRTLPRPETPRERLTLAVVTCQDFTNGYFGVYAHIAADDNVDFVLHLGDFIYETTGATAFQDAAFPDRRIVLPGDRTIAHGLDDYRRLYRRYREDPHLQRAMENHTFINAWDDHETANDCYWDYDRDTLGAPDHPFQVDLGNDAAALRQLKLDAQQAWAEYVPTRRVFNAAASHPFDALQIYREFRFGDLVELFLTDERTYRSPHPCGLGQVGERYLADDCDQRTDRSQTMLGATQLDWFISGITNSTAVWKLWGNQVFVGELSVGDPARRQIIINNDAWDGYAAERRTILEAIRNSGTRNLVTVTGDLHSYMASYMKIDHRRTSNFELDNVVGVEFMTPSVTSAGIAEIGNVTDPPVQDWGHPVLNRVLPRYFLEGLVRSANRHVRFFNSQDYGASTLVFTRSHCDWTAYTVDKRVGDRVPPIREIHSFRVPRDNPVLALGPIGS